jgi:hypothetical protein
MQYIYRGLMKCHSQNYPMSMCFRRKGDLSNQEHIMAGLAAARARGGNGGGKFATLG